MARLLDLDDDALQEPGFHHASNETATLPSDNADDRPDPNHSLRVSLILSCYPIVSQLVQYVDLNTIDELSRTCRQFRASLLQHRKLLMSKSLRCVNEHAHPSHRLGEALNASIEQWRAFGRNGVVVCRVSGGKVTSCARDLVGGCRRCGDIVCRNCVTKAPSERDLQNRHRRLCRTCMKAPLTSLTSRSTAASDQDDTSTTKYARGPCSCELHGIWICQPCGQTFRTVDTTYLRGWAWRSRYSACGGVGAGLGEGNEGVECGRGADCLNVREIENEIECESDEVAFLEADIANADVSGRQWMRNNYTTHEIVGLGGKVKKKIKKMVLVGAIVKEYEDERVSGKVLRREQEAANRSWCGWCLRVVPGKKDVVQPGESSDSIDSIYENGTTIDENIGIT